MTQKGILKTGTVRRLLVIFRLNGKLNTVFLVLCLMEVCVAKISIRRKILYMFHFSSLWENNNVKNAHIIITKRKHSAVGSTGLFQQINRTKDHGKLPQ